VPQGATIFSAVDQETDGIQNQIIGTEGASPELAINKMIRPAVQLAEATPDDSRPLGSGSTPNTDSVLPDSRTNEIKPTTSNEALGHNAKLPDGSLIPNPFPGPRNPTGYVIAPGDDLRDVAAAGRRHGERFRELKKSKWTYHQADAYLVAQFMDNIGAGGRFRGHGVTNC
jgi:hypothetical protein